MPISTVFHWLEIHFFACNLDNIIFTKCIFLKIKNDWKSHEKKKKRSVYPM